jgi:type IV pilus assembly protein PilB
MSAILAELIKKNIVTEGQVSDARQQRDSVGTSIQDILIDSGHLQSSDFYEVAQQVHAGHAIDLDAELINPKIIQLIRREDALRYGAVPLVKEGSTLIVAMSDPSDIFAIDEIGFMTGLNVKAGLSSHIQIAQYIQKYYFQQNSVQEILQDTIDDNDVALINDEVMTSDEIADIAISRADSSSFIRLVNRLLCDAVDARASDIHVEPRDKNVEVRYRIDGYLKTIIKIPRSFHPRLSSRIKILAKLDIAEQRKVQEGRIKVSIKGEKIDLRISVIPIFYGEKIVLRILDSRSTQFDINKIGFSSDELETFKTAIQRSQGVVLVTGPTGSGKTTSLYAALQHIKCETKNIVTIEDPIEYLIDGINQLQLSRFKDVTFTTGLRSILRQDPDVILVGEIRDKETAEIAFRASLTGHLVFSTLHTNSAVSSVTRLLNIGLEPYLISSSVSLLVAQRLVRMICPSCKEQCIPDPELLKKFKGYLRGSRLQRFYKGKGCEHCNFTGFYGRTSIFEIMKVDDRIKELIFNKASESLILKQATNNGMKTLVESGIVKVMAGITTLDEVAKVTEVVEERKEVSDLLDQVDRIVKSSLDRPEEKSSFAES